MMPRRKVADFESHPITEADLVCEGSNYYLPLSGPFKIKVTRLTEMEETPAGNDVDSLWLAYLPEFKERAVLAGADVLLERSPTDFEHSCRPWYCRLSDIRVDATRAVFQDLSAVYRFKETFSSESGNSTMEILCSDSGLYISEVASEDFSSIVFLNSSETCEVEETVYIPETNILAGDFSEAIFVGPALAELKEELKKNGAIV